MVKTQEVKDFLMDNRWIKGSYYTIDKDGGDAVCLVGAMAMAKGWNKATMRARAFGGFIPSHLDFAYDMPCGKYIALAIADLYPEYADGVLQRYVEKEEWGKAVTCIPTFNDNPYVTLEMIMEVLDEAIYLEKEDRVLNGDDEEEAENE